MPRIVLILLTELRPGGAERVVYELATHLDRGRFHPLVAALDGRGEYARRLRAAGVEVFDLGAPSVWRLDALWRLHRLLRARRVELLHTHLVHADVIGRLAAAAVGIPTVSTCHIVERRAVAWHFWLERLTARWCRAVACVSEAALRFQRERTRIAPEKFRLIPNGIDLRRFASMPPPSRARARLGLPADALAVGALGRLDAQKGFDLFLRAAAYCRELDPGSTQRLRFVLGGYGPQERELLELARSLGLHDCFTFAGYQPAPSEFLPALDIAVIPSRWEGFGLVVVEAMAAGLPVVATRVDSIPELLAAEQQGLLVAPEDPRELARAVLRLAADAALRRRLGEAGRTRARDFEITGMVAAYQRLYAEVLGPA